MAQNVVIAGATYNDVPSVNLITSDGSTANFVDTSDANAIANDILQGKTAYVDGEKIVGTGSGGGIPGEYNVYLKLNEQNSYNKIHLTNTNNISSSVLYNDMIFGTTFAPASGNYYYAYINATKTDIGTKIFNKIVYPIEVIRAYQFFYFGPIFISQTSGFRITEDNFYSSKIAPSNVGQPSLRFLTKYHEDSGATLSIGVDAPDPEDCYLCLFDADGVIIDVDNMLNIAEKMNNHEYSVDNGLTCVANQNINKNITSSNASISITVR